MCGLALQIVQQHQVINHIHYQPSGQKIDLYISSFEGKKSACLIFLVPLVLFVSTRTSVPQTAACVIIDRSKESNDIFTILCSGVLKTFKCLTQPKFVLDLPASASSVPGLQVLCLHVLSSFYSLTSPITTTLALHIRCYFSYKLQIHSLCWQGRMETGASS